MQGQKKNVISQEQELEKWKFPSNIAIFPTTSYVFLYI